MPYFDVNTTQSLGLYTATFAAVAVTAAQDVFSILAPAGRRVGIRSIYLNQYSDFADAQAEILSVSLVRGNSVAGSGGSAFTPLKLRPWMGDAGSTVRINDTTVASGGTPEVLVADGWNVAAGWVHAPSDDERIWIEESTRLAVRITLPADSLTCNGTIMFEEVSK